MDQNNDIGGGDNEEKPMMIEEKVDLFETKRKNEIKRTTNVGQRFSFLQYIEYRLR